MRETTHDNTYNDVRIHSKATFNGPIILWIGAPILAVCLFCFVVYVVFYWPAFVTLTGYLPWPVGTVLGLLIVGVASRAGVAIYHKAGTARLEHARAKGEVLRSSTVLVEQESYTLVLHPTTRKLELLQPVQDQYRYNIKVPETAMLPAAPGAPQLSGRTLIMQGCIDRALAAGKYLLGYDEQGEIKEVSQRDLYNLLLAGIPGSGKSTTGLWIAGQRVKAGGLYMASDPHLYYQDDEGRKSLGESLAPFSISRLIETDDGSTSGLIVKLNHMLRELTKRQKPGYIVRAQDNWLWIIDEFNSVIDAMDEAGKSEQFAKGLALLQREGRKFGLHTMLMGHRFSRDDIGKVKIRSVASNILEHKMTDEQQAKVLIGSKGSKAVDLNIGDYLLSGILSTSIERIHTPLFEARDMPLLFGTSTATSGVRPGYVQTPQSHVHTQPLDEPGTQPDMAELPDHLHAKVGKVLQADGQGDISQNEIIRRIWGIEPQGRPGQAAADELRIIRRWIAQHMSMEA